MKYNNKFTMVDGIRFHSKKEANRYAELKLLQQAGHITDLKLQPKYELIPSFILNGKKIRAIHYIADFEYVEKTTGETIVEDVKPSKNFKTDVYKLKKKLFEYQYNKEITEIY